MNLMINAGVDYIVNIGDDLGIILILIHYNYTLNSAL